MRIAYITDLHGFKPGYEAVFNYALRQDIKIIHLGADILPKGSGILSAQKDFVKKYLKEYYKRAANAGITLLAFFGNDDLYTRKKYFREYGTLLDEVPQEIEGYSFQAYGFCPDYPFGLKSACKYDSVGWRPEPYISTPVEATEEGLVPILDVKSYFEAKGTIKNDMDAIKGHDKLIMACHCPPSGLGLDVCLDGREVGSDSIRRWIVDQKPLLVLSGHIHEAPLKTHRWESKLGPTLVIQPGQYVKDISNNVSFVDIEIKGNEITTYHIEKRVL